MTLAEQLTEQEELKAIIKQGLINNASTGSVLAYTTNNTKVTYEGATESYKLLSVINQKIQTIKSNQSHLARIAS